MLTELKMSCDAVVEPLSFRFESPILGIIEVGTSWAALPFRYDACMEWAVRTTTLNGADPLGPRDLAGLL